jgi:16S rRNA (guanine966-N2)-methyltransferase
LSRGAVKAVFVDSEAQCLKAISDSARRLGCTAEAVLINSDYRKALLRLAEQKYSFDAVFMDPPYELEVNKDIIVELKERGLLKSSGVIVAEQEKEPEPLEGFSLKTYKYSYKKVGIYRIKEQIK